MLHRPLLIYVLEHSYRSILTSFRDMRCFFFTTSNKVQKIRESLHQGRISICIEGQVLPIRYIYMIRLTYNVYETHTQESSMVMVKTTGQQESPQSQFPFLMQLLRRNCIVLSHETCRKKLKKNMSYIHYYMRPEKATGPIQLIWFLT